MSARTVVERIAAGVGVLGLLALLPVYLSAGLVAPLWAIALLFFVWLSLTWTAVRQFVRLPWLVLVLPVIAFAIWWLTLTAGEQLLGWQA